jgi:hypothetical protein
MKVISSLIFVYTINEWLNRLILIIILIVANQSDQTFISALIFLSLGANAGTNYYQIIKMH